MAGTPIDPSYQFNIVTPSDTADLTYTDVNGRINYYKTKALWVGTTGDLEVLNDAGVAIVIPNVAPGMMHPISTQRVLATNTTAIGIIAFF